MSGITSYRDLLAWQKAIDLVDLVYDITAAFPRSELFGLVQQMRKAAVSIPSNIAEGSRHRTAGYISRLIISLGEHAELETQAIIGERRQYISRSKMNEFDSLATRVGQLAHGLLRSLETSYENERLRRRRESRSPKPKSRLTSQARTRS
jgi:four helix bundle protein